MKLNQMIKVSLILLSGAFTVGAEDLELVASFPKEVPPGNIAISGTGRVFMSVHGFYGVPAARVVEVHSNGETSPYPNNFWAKSDSEKAYKLGDVLGVRVDQSGVLWMIEGQSKGHTGRLVGWDTEKEKLHKVYYLGEPATKPNSFLNDISVDLKNNKIYIADSVGAIIIVDMGTGLARRVLEGSKYTSPENIDMIIHSKTIHLGGEPARVGINPITIDEKNEWLYFGAMSSRNLYRVRIADLLNEGFTEEQLRKKVEKYGDKPISDGSTIDSKGNVYITSVTDHSIGVVTPNGEYKTLFQSDDLAWPDGFSVGADGMIYVTVNELFRSPVLNGGESSSQGLFKLMRFKPLAPAVIGR